jgi:tetratricopeptide (TPR) repeat protein
MRLQSYLRIAKIIPGGTSMQVRNGIVLAVALGLVGGVIALPAQAAPPAKSATEGYNSAWALWSKGNSAHAEVLLKLLVEKFPQDARLGLFLAASLASHAPEPDVETCFSRVVELGAKSSKPTLEALVAQHFLQLSDPDIANEAFASLTELAQKNSHYPVVTWLYAQAAERMEKPEIAEKAFKALLTRTKNAPAAVRQGYASALEAQGKHFFALEHRLKVASSNESPATLHALSANLKSIARFREAAVVAERATKSFPDAPQGWYDLGIATVALRRTEQAERFFAQALTVAESSPEKFDRSATLLAWGMCLESQKKFRAAAEKFRQVASLEGVSNTQVREANRRARAAELASGGN